MGVGARGSLLLTIACAAALATPALSMDPPARGADLALVNRVTWGINPADARAIGALGPDRWLEQQLNPPRGDHLPRAVQDQIDASYGGHASMAATLTAIEDQRAASLAAAGADADKKQAAQQAYQQALNAEVRQAQLRSVLRALYSADQLREQMTWFWFNHFNVSANKADIRAMVGDYEDTALRPHALGRFRDLLEATLRHPAMLRYLDNADNAVGHINENYAREIMELHTMGVGSGYTQKDVQELARILTGVGVDLRPNPPRLPPALQGQLIRQGLFEFNPNRHDYGDKVFLGHVIRGAGFGEVEQALDILTREPATARHISRQLATYFVADAPPQPLVDAMTATFQRTDGDISDVLRTMFRSPQFHASLGSKFKDPVHYVYSAIRLAYGDRVILNAGPAARWLDRLGEGLYRHETPDGYSMTTTGWDGPGQMESRFELARQIGSGGAGLFKSDAPGAVDQPGFPQLQNALYYEALAKGLAPATTAALNQAISPQDWNALFLSSPDFMRR